MRTCPECGETKPFSEYHKHTGRPNNVAFYCKVCATARSKRHHRRRMKEDPNYRTQKRNSYVQGQWNMTSDEYEAAWKAQGTCAICRIELRGGVQTHLDHNHSTGELRKFLCTNCNRGLGHFKDNAEFLKRAANYLEES